VRSSADRDCAEISPLDQGAADYYDATNRDLRYATNASGTWSSRAVDTVGDVGLSTSIGVDAGGVVHIAYLSASQYAGAQPLKYATNAGGEFATWEIDYACPGMAACGTRAPSRNSGEHGGLRSTEMHGVERPRPLLG
jgi:hypothetical protein